MKKISTLLSIFVLITSQKMYAQAFAGLYNFNNVTTTSGLVDPTPVPTATGLTFGSFAAYGTPTNPNSTLRFNFQNWPGGATSGNDNYTSLTGNLSTGEYYEVTLTPSLGYSIALNGITFTTQRSSTGMRTYSVRSSLDGYTTNLPASINPSNANLSVQTGDIFFWNFDATVTAQNGNTITPGPAFSNLMSPVTFRFYGWNTETSVGNFSIDNVGFAGAATALQIVTDFTASATACEGTAVQFTDNTQSFNGPITTWSWNFGDPVSGPNNTSALQNPQHTFSNCGTYTVQLFSANSNNDTDSSQMSITVLCNPGAAFSATPLAGCGQICVDFTDLSTGPPATWTWDFGDLSSDVTQNPNHCYINPGMYSVMLTVTASNGCSGSAVTLNYINVFDAPVTNFSGLVAGSTVTFANNTTGGTPAYNFQWDFGDGSPFDNTPNPAHTYVIDGVYTVCLTVTDQNGCTDTTCHTAAVFTTGIALENSGSSISIYPNPSQNGIFNLDLKENSMISIFDLIGKELRKEKMNTGLNTIDLHEFSNGTYFIQVKNENGTVIKKVSIDK